MRQTFDKPQYDSFYKGRRVCITGGAGFIGSTLCRALLDLGAQVSVIDDLSNGLEANLADLGDRIDFVRGSILDPTALDEAVEGTDVIFHQAAISSVPRSVKEPGLYHETNITGTMRVLESARAGGVSRLVNASSSSVYGEQAESSKVETMYPDPRSPYAASKIAAEHLLSAYARCYDLSTISLRYFNIYGPRQRPDSPYAAVIPKFAESMLQDKPCVIFGDGAQTRDYTHVANAVHANLLAGSVDRKPIGEAINVACGESWVLTKLVEMMGELLDVEPVIRYDPPRPGDVLHSKADIGLARELIGYEPLNDFKAGLDDALNYYRSQLVPEAE